MFAVTAIFLQLLFIPSLSISSQGTHQSSIASLSHSSPGSSYNETLLLEAIRLADNTRNLDQLRPQGSPPLLLSARVCVSPSFRTSRPPSLFLVDTHTHNAHAQRVITRTRTTYTHTHNAHAQRTTRTHTHTHNAHADCSGLEVAAGLRRFVALCLCMKRETYAARKCTRWRKLDYHHHH